MHNNTPGNVNTWLESRVQCFNFVTVVMTVSFCLMPSPLTLIVGVKIFHRKLYILH